MMDEHAKMMFQWFLLELAGLEHPKPSRKDFEDVCSTLAEMKALIADFEKQVEATYAWAKSPIKQGELFTSHLHPGCVFRLDHVGVVRDDGGRLMDFIYLVGNCVVSNPRIITIKQGEKYAYYSNNVSKASPGQTETTPN